MIDDRHIPDNLLAEKPEKGAVQETLFGFILRMSGKHQFFLCLLAIITTVLELIPIELQRRIIDTAIENSNYEAFIYLGGTYAVILVLHQFTKFIFRLYQAWVAESTMKNTRRRLIEVRAGSVPENGGNGGSTVSVISNEVEGIGTFVGEHISDASANIMMLLGAAGYMLYVEPQIAVYALLFFIPQIFLVPFMQRLLNRLISIRVGLMRDLGDEVSEIDGPIDEPPAIVSKVYKNRIRYSLVKYAMKSLINLLTSLGPLTVLLMGGYLVLQGETTAGVIVAFLSGFQRMSGPMRGLISFYRLAQQTNVQHCMVENWVKDQKGGQ